MFVCSWKPLEHPSRKEGSLQHLSYKTTAMRGRDFSCWLKQLLKWGWNIHIFLLQYYPVTSVTDPGASRVGGSRVICDTVFASSPPQWQKFSDVSSERSAEFLPKQSWQKLLLFLTLYRPLGPRHKYWSQVYAGTLPGVLLTSPWGVCYSWYTLLRPTPCRTPHISLWTSKVKSQTSKCFR